MKARKTINPATRKLFEYGLIGLVIAAVLIVGIQVRPQSVFPSTGTLQVAITDGPSTLETSSHGMPICHGECVATSLTISVASIEAHTSGITNATGEWTPVCTNYLPFTVDLVNLRNLTKIICGAKVRPESITNVRIFVGSANATISGKAFPLTVPSGKLEIPLSPAVSVEGGKMSTIVMDLQPHIVCEGNGQCKLTPVLIATSEGPD